MDNPPMPLMLVESPERISFCHLLETPLSPSSSSIMNVGLPQAILALMLHLLSLEEVMRAYDPKGVYFVRQNLPQDVMCDFSRDEENVRHVKEHHSEIARETLGKAAKMKFHATGLGNTPLLMVNHKEKVKRVKELYDQCAIPCSSNEPSSDMAGQEEEEMHASRSTWMVREGREASTVEASDPVLSADYSVLSSTALKARVVSLEKQRFDALIRAFKAKEAQTKAEKSKNASEKQLQAKKDEFKALKKKHKDEIRHLQRKHKAALKKAEDRGFKKGKRCQLDLMKEALAFFDAEFRFEDFVPSLEYIENDRKKSVEAAVRLVRLEAEQFASQSKDDKPLDAQNVLQTSLLFGEYENVDGYFNKQGTACCVNWHGGGSTMAQSIVPHHVIRMPEMSSTDAELVQLLMEQASWKPSHTSLSNSALDIRYPLIGRKRPFPVLEHIIVPDFIQAMLGQFLVVGRETANLQTLEIGVTVRRTEIVMAGNGGGGFHGGRANFAAGSPNLGFSGLGVEELGGRRGGAGGQSWRT
ncbi:hypothetical protein Cgig2_005910 [Carnegiea gigantea]|uniref:Uncharacterized protein n=1 Tax=Carnegiea gigantea TaxID=171969 RepID=A0A9Q1JZD2_9CARY|nr:hypothetical protein Cgig2_005910 [Carnegiea gigantea]